MAASLKRSVCALAGVLLSVPAWGASPAAACVARSAALLQEGATDNVVILLDASGSMEKPMLGDGRTIKMDAAKLSIAKVLETVPQSTQVGLLVFSGRNKAEDWVFPLGPRNDEQLIQSLFKIQPDGKTPLGAYMKLAADRLLEQRAKQSGYGTFRLLIVTDGRSGDPELVDRHLPDMLSRGMRVDAIGVSMREDHPLATRVNSYRRANDPTALKAAISDVFAEVSGAGIDDAVAEEGFELLQLLPDDSVLPILDTLTAHENTPIGQVRPRPEEARSEPVRDAASRDSSGKQERRDRRRRARDGWFSPRLFFFLLALFFISRAMRGKKRRRRKRRRERRG